METPKEMLIKTIQKTMGYNRRNAEKYAKKIIKIGKELYKKEK